MKKEGFEKNPIYLEWLDSSRTDGWVRADDAKPGSLKCRTIGWVVKDTKTSIIIGGHMAEDPVQVCGILEIPKCAITHIRNVPVKKKQRKKTRNDCSK